MTDIARSGPEALAAMGPREPHKPDAALAPFLRMADRIRAEAEAHWNEELARFGRRMRAQMEREWDHQAAKVKGMTNAR